MKKKNTKIFVFLEGTSKEERIEKEKIQISHSSQGNRSRDVVVYHCILLRYRVGYRYPRYQTWEYLEIFRGDQK
jgi:hypothetical protein